MATLFSPRSRALSGSWTRRTLRSGFRFSSGSCFGRSEGRTAGVSDLPVSPSQNTALLDHLLSLSVALLGAAFYLETSRQRPSHQAGSLQSVREQIPPESGPVPLRDADAYAPCVGHGFEQPQARERRHRRVVFERDAREERSEPLEPSFSGPRRIERRRQELRAPRIERRSGLAQRPAQGFEPARAERALFREVRKIARGSLEDLERPGDAGKKRVLESQVQARTAAASHRLEIGKGPPRLGDEPLCDRGPIEALDEERRGPGEPFARAQALHRLVEKQAAVLERLVRKATRHRARVTRRAGIELQPLLEREAHAPPRPREAACKKSAPGGCRRRPLAACPAASPRAPGPPAPPPHERLRQPPRGSAGKALRRATSAHRPTRFGRARIAPRESRPGPHAPRRSRRRAPAGLPAQKLCQPLPCGRTRRVDGDGALEDLLGARQVFPPLAQHGVEPPDVLADPVRARPPAPLQCGEDVPVLEDRAAPVPARFGPVSYTHLTLPTKRIV